MKGRPGIVSGPRITRGRVPGGVSWYRQVHRRDVLSSSGPCRFRSHFHPKARTRPCQLVSRKADNHDGNTHRFRLVTNEMNLLEPFMFDMPERVRLIPPTREDVERNLAADAVRQAKWRDGLLFFFIPSFYFEFPLELFDEKDARVPFGSRVIEVIPRQVFGRGHIVKELLWDVFGLRGMDVRRSRMKQVCGCTDQRLLPFLVRGTLLVSVRWRGSEDGLGIVPIVGMGQDTVNTHRGYECLETRTECLVRPD